MITGDHIDTAVAIAKNLGICEDASQAITGAELDKISDEDFHDKVTEYSVYARVQPEHKRPHRRRVEEPRQDRRHDRPTA